MARRAWGNFIANAISTWMLAAAASPAFAAPVPGPEMTSNLGYVNLMSLTANPTATSSTVGTRKCAGWWKRYLERIEFEGSRIRRPHTILSSSQIEKKSSPKGKPLLSPPLTAAQPNGFA